MIKIVIADDHQMFIDGIKSLLKNEKGIKVVGEALNGNEVLSLLAKEKADIVLMDVNMPEMDGIEATNQVRVNFPDVKVIMLTMYNKYEFISGLINAGASGYILKNTGRSELVEAIQTVHFGKTYYSKQVVETALQNFSKTTAEQKIESAHLTAREKEVLKLIAQEFTIQEISDKLFISGHTVETHQKNLMSKLNVKNIAGLVKIALQTGLISENALIFLEEKVDERTRELVMQKKRSDDLLLNILPSEVAEELKQKGTADAHQYDDVTVLFTDFVNFTEAGERMTPQQLVGELHTCFKAFDGILGKYNIEKIKTVGDAYIAVSGLPTANQNHAADIVAAAVEITGYMHQRKAQLGDATFDIRIGINSGSVVAGIVGVKKFAYDIWGDTVNTAARMEQNSEPGKINISETTYQLVKDKFECGYRGEIEAKNKGAMKMYFVTKYSE